jgi:hypothetical protein
VRFIGAAPSVKPVIAIGVTDPVGVVRAPEELKVREPVASEVGAPVPPVADAGKVML